MGAMELLGSPTTMGPLLLRDLVSSIFVFFDNSFIGLAQNHKLLHFIRSLLISSFLFFLRILPSLNPNSSDNNNHKPSTNDVVLGPATSFSAESSGAGDSGLSRALSQLLSIANEIPVSSRKYDVVRSLAERIIDDNEKEGSPALREVNQTVLSAAFARTLSQLERAVSSEVGHLGDVARGGAGTGAAVEHRLGWAVARAVRSVGELVGRARGGGGAGQAGRSGISAEKLAAELLWLAQKLAACGSVEEAVWRWASAADLAWLAVSAEPRLQCSLVKLSALLFKQGKDIRLKEGDESKNKEHYNQMKMQMLQSWLPLLCRASNGTDAPVLSSTERAELERVLEGTIEMLEEEDQQEKVLTLWLHHFTHCSASDWPNLHASYARWCSAARNKLLLNHC